MSDKSDFERGLASFRKVVTGVTGRLLGPKAIGREALSADVTISAETDEAITRAGDDLGRLFAAAGEGLKAHPLEPDAAFREARARSGEAVEGKDGWSPMAAGLMTLGGGLARVAEGVLDTVAPRKAKQDPTEADPPPPVSDAS